MSSKRPGSSWISMNYDKLALSIVLVVLTASAFLLVSWVGQKRRALADAPWEQPPLQQAQVEAIDTTPYEQAMVTMAKPFQATVHGKSLATSELRVSCVSCKRPVAFDAKVCPFCRVAQPSIDDITKFDGDGDGIPDEVERRLGLNPVDPIDGSGDIDGDLFTNYEEFQAGTDLNSATNFPPPPAKLRVARTFVNPFMLRFLGVQQVAEGAGGERYQLNARTLDRTYFAKMGEDIEGFTVSAYEPNAAGGPTLVMSQGSRMVPLIKGQVVQQDARNARIVSLLDGSATNVSVKSSLKIKDFEYKVVDIQVDRIVIRDASTGAESTVFSLTEDEKTKLQGGLGGGFPDAGSPMSVPGGDGR